VAIHNSDIETVFLKLDFEKAFDSISWDFLFELLLARGFGKCWIDWIKLCLFSGTSSILVNEQPENYIKCHKDLRQGDPFPYHFILVADTIHEYSPLPVIMVASKRWVFSLGRIVWLASTMPITHSSSLREMLDLSSPSIFFFMNSRL